MNDLRVAVVQFQHAAGDKAKNLERIHAYVREAAAQDVKLVGFPECCISGYWHLRKLSRDQLWDLAECVPEGPATQTLMRWALQYQITISAGLVERSSEGKLYNTQVIALPDGRCVRHRKLHCFINRWMDSGDEFTVFELPTGQRVGVLICYDNNLIENARATALMGAEILLAPHQTGGCQSRSPQAMGRIDVALWENRESDPESLRQEFLGDKGRGWLMRWLPSRAHDNGLFLLFANGIGRDDDEVRTGNAMILDPYGRILVESTEIGDAMVIADLDGSLRAHSTGCRWLQARRPELYGGLSQGHQQRSTRDVRFEISKSTNATEADLEVRPSKASS